MDESSKRAKKREIARQATPQTSPSSSRQSTPCSSTPNSSRPVSPFQCSSPSAPIASHEECENELCSALTPNEQSLEGLPFATSTPSEQSVSVEDSISLSDVSSLHSLVRNTETEVLVNTALVARIEMLEAENRRLKKLDVKVKSHFTVESLAGNDKLIKLYTGFSSYSVFLSFYAFLGPSVNELSYWGEADTVSKRPRRRKLTSLNQFFLTMIKLKLNFRNTDLAFRFGISASLVSRYFTTWVCFLYCHLKEIQWMPDVEQVKATLPNSFHQKYPTTYTIIDGSELFIQTPSDLYLQSSTWSSYKHKNTAKFLVGCTPNGCINFISPLYVGSISDVELTRVSGFIDKMDGKAGVSVMADRGFTVKDQLDSIGVELNIPPFLEGRQQLPADQVQRGRYIASLRIHVERAIGRIKQFAILQGTFPLSMVRLLNQIVCVCAWLTNFHPVLLPPPLLTSEVEEVESYFQNLDLDSESDSDAEQDT